MNIKTIICSLLVIISFPCLSTASEFMLEGWTSKDVLNGRSIIASIESEGSAGRERAKLYIKGVVDDLYSAIPDKMRSLYTPMESWYIPDKVIEYYQKDAAQRQKNVVDVILSGCK